MFDQLLGALTHYGAPALFAIVAIAALGLPLPVTLLLIVTGSLVAQEAINMFAAIAIAALGSIFGDQVGYAIGRWGGQALVNRFSRFLGGADRLKEIDAKTRQWGGAGIFFSRWLVSPLGPWINLASGLAGYSWLRFSFWDVLGETFGAALFIWLGHTFSDRVQQLGAMTGDIGWAIIALLAATVFGWKLFSSRRNPER